MALHHQQTPPHTIIERDASGYVGYTPATLRAWRRQGKGPAYIRVGRSIRYRPVDLDAWLGAHRVTPRGSRIEAGK